MSYWSLPSDQNSPSHVTVYLLGVAFSEGFKIWFTLFFPRSWCRDQRPLPLTEIYRSGKTRKVDAGKKKKGFAIIEDASGRCGLYHSVLWDAIKSWGTYYQAAVLYSLLSHIQSLYLSILLKARRCRNLGGPVIPHVTYSLHRLYLATAA